MLVLGQLLSLSLSSDEQESSGEGPLAACREINVTGDSTYQRTPLRLSQDAARDQTAATMSSTPESNPEQYAAPAPLTPEQLAALPHDNQAPKLLASIWSLIFVATVFLCLRIYCRLLRGQRLWWDDSILIASWVRANLFFGVKLWAQERR